MKEPSVSIGSVKELSKFSAGVVEAVQRWFPGVVVQPQLYATLRGIEWAINTATLKEASVLRLEVRRQSEIGGPLSGCWIAGKILDLFYPPDASNIGEIEAFWFRNLVLRADQLGIKIDCGTDGCPTDDVLSAFCGGAISVVDAIDSATNGGVTTEDEHVA